MTTEKKTAPKLSILIPSLFSRAEQLAALMGEIGKQCQTETRDFRTVENPEVSQCIATKAVPVEILTAIDGGAASVGEKRNTLLRAASGDYVVFVDDDDEVSNVYVGEILAAMAPDASGVQPDIITFEVEYIDLSQRSRCTFIQSLKYSEKTEIAPQLIGCPPTHTAAWRREIALANSFPPISYAEDWLWWQPLLQSGLVKTEYHINWPLYVYRFDGRKSATQKREQRQEALEWAGLEGVAFYGGGKFRIVGFRSGELMEAKEVLDFNSVPYICTCKVT